MLVNGFIQLPVETRIKAIFKLIKDVFQFQFGPPENKWRKNKRYKISKTVRLNQ